MNRISGSKYDSSSFQTSKGLKNDIEYNKNHKRQELIDNHVKSNGYIELKNDYFGMDSYYYDKTNKIMYKVCNICDSMSSDAPVFEISNDKHILLLNSIDIAE